MLARAMGAATAITIKANGMDIFMIMSLFMAEHPLGLDNQDDDD